MYHNREQEKFAAQNASHLKNLKENTQLVPSPVSSSSQVGAGMVC
jgi:hypothetical protein